MEDKIILYIKSGGKHNTRRLEIAKKLGCRIAVVEKGYENELGLADFVIHADTNNIDELLVKIIEFNNINPISAVVNFGEATVEQAAIIADILNLPGLSPTAARLCRNKFLTRARLSRFSNILQPKFALLKNIEEIESAVNKVTYPFILKPLKLSGSCSVYKINNPSELNEVLNIVKEERGKCSINKIILDSLSDYWLIEEYIDGFEISVESVTLNGYTEVLAIHDKMTPVEGPLFLEEYFVTPSPRIEPDLKECIENITKDILKGIGLNFGLSHTEFRITKDKKPMLVEVNARQGGGLIPDSVNYSTGIDLVETVIKMSLGLPVDFSPKFSKPIAHRTIYSPEGVVKEILGIDGIEEKEGILKLKKWIDIGGTVCTTQCEYALDIMVTAANAEKAFERVKEYSDSIKYIT